MKPLMLSLAFLVAAVPAHAADPAPSGDDRTVAGAEEAVKHFFGLQEIYLGIGQKDSKPSAEDQKQATTLVLEESKLLDQFIPALEGALQKNIAPRDVTAPSSPQVSLAIYYGGTADDVWEKVRAKANLASNLAFIYRSRQSKNASAEKLVDAERRLPELKADLAKANKKNDPATP